MRAFFNAILAVLGTSSLTDEEFETCEATVALYNQATYDDLSAVLASRELVTDLQDRLIAYYAAAGFQVVPADTAKSNIYLGAVLN